VGLEEIYIYIYQSAGLKYNPTTKPAETGGKANFLLGLNFNPEDDGDMYLRSVTNQITVFVVTANRTSNKTFKFTVAYFVEALCYKVEGRVIESQ
jgi:hypothetical protein